MSTDGLFAGTGAYYARFRPGYPQAFFDDIIHRFALDGTGRLLDLGCGTGQLTVPLARHVAEAIGLDPEPDMLAQARTAGVGNVRWVHAGAENLPPDLGRFRLVTIGRAFHWMNRTQVLNALTGMVESNGGLVIANDGCMALASTPWQHAIEDVQRHYLGPHPSSSPQPEPHEAVLARSPFNNITKVTHEFERTWTPDQIIGYLYSTSLPLHRLLGPRRPAFERDLTNALLALNPEGHFLEPVKLQVLIARPAVQTLTRGAGNGRISRS
ncbi:class I SAM-dependent methyltransferase [Nonomuraea monospora]|uniref:Class I SAM-dependent methyltransferase n=1 Tax=Nonomuraea monospora TaxID=568818 RepID=A0ABP5P226_9ACTN